MKPRSRTEFLTDKEYQEYSRKLFAASGLNPDIAASISVDTGFVQTFSTMTLTPKKISKSEQ